MVDYEFYKSLYEREQDIRIAYDNRMELTVTLTVAIVTADAFLCESIAPWHEETNIKYFLFICISLLLLLLAHMVFIGLAYTSLKFRYRDFPVDMLEPDIKEHIAEYKSLNPQATNEEVKNELEKYIPHMFEVTYKLCATEYYRENIRRRKFHFCLAITAVANAIAIILFYVINFFRNFI